MQNLADVSLIKKHFAEKEQPCNTGGQDENGRLGISGEAQRADDGSSWSKKRIEFVWDSIGALRVAQTRPDKMDQGRPPGHWRCALY